jgi:hypothetical protein
MRERLSFLSLKKCLWTDDLHKLCNHFYIDAF